MKSRISRRFLAIAFMIVFLALTIEGAGYVTQEKSDDVYRIVAENAERQVSLSAVRQVKMYLRRIHPGKLRPKNSYSGKPCPKDTARSVRQIIPVLLMRMDITTTGVPLITCICTGRMNRVKTENDLLNVQVSITTGVCGTWEKILLA